MLIPDPSAPGPEKKTVGWVTQLVVHESYRRRGIATALLHNLLVSEAFRNVSVLGVASSHPATCAAVARLARASPRHPLSNLALPSSRRDVNRHTRPRLHTKQRLHRTSPDADTVPPGRRAARIAFRGRIPYWRRVQHLHEVLHCSR